MSHGPTDYGLTETETCRVVATFEEDASAYVPAEPQVATLGPLPPKKQPKNSKTKAKSSRARRQTVKAARNSDRGETMTESIDYPLVVFEDYAESDPSGEPEVIIIGGSLTKSSSKKATAKAKSRSTGQAAKASRTKKKRKR